MPIKKPDLDNVVEQKSSKYGDVYLNFKKFCKENKKPHGGASILSCYEFTQSPTSQASDYYRHLQNKNYVKAMGKEEEAEEFVALHDALALDEGRELDREGLKENLAKKRAHERIFRDLEGTISLYANRVYQSLDSSRVKILPSFWFAVLEADYQDKLTKAIESILSGRGIPASSLSSRK